MLDQAVRVLACLVAGAGLVACAGNVSDRAAGDDDDRPGDEDGEGQDDVGADGDDDGVAPPPVFNPDGKKRRIRNDALGLSCETGTRSEPTPLSRLTNREYVNTLKALFPGTLATDPVMPTESLFDGFRNNVGGQAPSDVLVEAFETTGDGLAAKIVDKVVTCKPTDAAGERACLDGVLDGFAAKLFRRPLNDGEKSRFRTFFAEERAMDDFRTSMTTLLAGLLQAPQFLYRVEEGKGTGARRPLSGYEMASRLSYLVWDAPPDDALYTAAADGALEAPEGIGREVERLLGDARAKPALVELAAQWLAFDKLGDFAQVARKDRTLFSKYTDKTEAALAAGLVRFAEWVLVDQGGSLKALLTGPKAFASADSAWIYGTAAPAGGTLAAIDTDAGKRVGLLGQAGFLAGMAHERLTGPILRGAFVLERFLCAAPPPPPPDVDQAVVKAAASDALTNRERITMTHQVGACAECHKIIDPVGFTLEHFDAVGAWQDRDNGKPVDASGVIRDTFDADGAVNGLPELAAKLAASEQVAECSVAHVMKYALARSLGPGDGCELAGLTDQLIASQDWSLRGLVVALAQSPTFRTRTVEEP